MIYYVLKPIHRALKRSTTYLFGFHRNRDISVFFCPVLYAVPCSQNVRLYKIEIRWYTFAVLPRQINGICRFAAANQKPGKLASLLCPFTSLLDPSSFIIPESYTRFVITEQISHCFLPTKVNICKHFMSKKIYEGKLF